MTLKAIKVSSMGYDIYNDKGEHLGYAKKVGFNKYRLTVDNEFKGYYTSVEACITRLSK